MKIMNKSIIAAIMLMSSVTAQADGLYMKGTVAANLDSATDYLDCSNPEEGCKPMQGMATLEAGYAVDTSFGQVSAGVIHYSNPFTGKDYGGNGLFISGCVGEGC